MNQTKAIVLAAGKGTRLRTEGVDLPKVLRTACGKPLIGYVLDSLSFLAPEDIILVVGYRKEQVLATYPQYPHAVQDQQLGTGHAVQCAAPLLEGFQGSVLVCCGDAPMMTQATFQSLISTHDCQQNACTMLSARVADPGSYGRVTREADGSFRAIVEAKDCTPEQLAIQEVNSGTYVFRSPDLLWALSQLKSDNAQREYYLTDCPAILKSAGRRVGLCDSCTEQEMLGVNTIEQLQQVESLLSR